MCFNMEAFRHDYTGEYNDFGFLHLYVESPGTQEVQCRWILVSIGYSDYYKVKGPLVTLFLKMVHSSW